MNKVKSFGTSPNQSKGIIVQGSTLTYTDQIQSRRVVSWSRISVEGLPRAKSVHLYSLFRELPSLRRDIAADFMLPVIKAVDALQGGAPSAKDLQKILRAITGHKRDAISSTLSDTELLISQAIVRSLNHATTRLRRAGLKVDASQHPHRLDRYHSFVNKIRMTNDLVGLYDRAERHATAYAKGELSKGSFQRSLIDSSFVPTPGGSLTKGVRKLRRTEYQRLDHAVSRDIYLEHGVAYCHWRLSGNHKDYGGAEVCEVLANSTGSAAQGSSFSKRGLYHINEFPSVPHPNCMCQMVPAG